jgi:2-polyprenyl-6-hydroxyphenyl methylase/3-demethylubiquinone-9 3-methyltransferase
MEVYGHIDRSGYAAAYAERRRHTLELVQKAVAPPATILDIAAAQGNFTLTLAEQGYPVTWNDLRADLAGYVQLKHEKGTVHYAPGNAFELAFEHLFDLVLIAEVIEHVAHPDQFLVNTARLVRPGGYVVMTTPHGGYVRNRLPRFSDYADPSVFESQQFSPDSNGHIFLLHTDEVHALAAKAGLHVIEHRVFTNVLTNGHMKTAALHRALPARAIAAIESVSTRLPMAAPLHTSMATLMRRV